MSILARSRPYANQNASTYTCRRCGIQRTCHNTRNKPTHCIDCRPYTKELT